MSVPERVGLCWVTIAIGDRLFALLICGIGRPSPHELARWSYAQDPFLIKLVDSQISLKFERQRVKKSLELC